MPTILGANTLSGAYDVANSLRLNSGDSPYMHKVKSSNDEVSTATFSAWVKRSKLGANQRIVSHMTNGFADYFYFRFNSSDVFEFAFKGSTNNIIWTTNRVFKDVSAWYHIVARVDTTDGTAGDRVRIYVNGTQETSFSASTNPDQNETFSIGTTSDPIVVGGLYGSGYGISSGSTSEHFGGYIAELVVCEGQSLGPTSFGEFDDDTPTVWKPKNVSGLTFGTNGFYLDFQDSGNLGNDANGGTDLTEVNIAATDQSTDTCTNNSVTMNSLDDNSTSSTFSEGNLKVVTAASGSPPHFATIGLTTGKWYWEVKATSFTENPAGYICIGITANQANSTTNQLGHLSGDYAFVNNGNIEAGTGNDTSYGNSYTQGQIIGVYLDLDNNKLYFSINGSLQDSGTGHDITAAASTTAGFYMPSFSDYSSSSSNLVTVEFNFGAGTTFSISSGNDDGEYGNFEYSTTITGDGVSKTFKAINTKNLAESG